MRVQMQQDHKMFFNVIHNLESDVIQTFTKKNFHLQFDI